ncbi:MAG: 2-oxoacid:acceptor oxidoreductase subunit alpha [Desulfotomaculales bacterium]
MEFLQGNEAFARAGVDAGARFFAGYPISPATEIAELCAELMPRHGGIYVQMEDEIASLAAVIGASLGGLKAFTATSGPGLALMLENVGFAVMAEVPCVIIHVQRFGPSTGIATAPAQGDLMTVRWGVNGDHRIVVLTPSSVQECYDLTVEGFNLAERFRVPVIVLADAVLAHLRERVVVGESLRLVNRARPAGPPHTYRPYRPLEKEVPALAAYGDEYILRVTGLVHDEDGYSTANPEVAAALVRRLVDKVERYREELPGPVYYGSGAPRAVLISFGIAARAARAAVARALGEGINVGLLQLRTLWPFPEEEVVATCREAVRVLVVEMNQGQLCREVRACGIPPHRVSGVNRTDGRPITPAEVLAAIREVVS